MASRLICLRHVDGPHRRSWVREDRKRLAALVCGLVLSAAPALAAAVPVLMISVDGLRRGEVTEAEQRGIKVPHGYFPEHATFIMQGPGVPRAGSIGEIDQRDIAPTVAKTLGVAVPSADGKPLF